MATYTEFYQLTKPVRGAEVVDVNTLNSNSDKIDAIMHSSQISIADAYDQTQTYELRDKVMYEMLLYECISRITVPEVWTPAHWERCTAADVGGNYVDVDEKYLTGLNVADVDIDGDQHAIKVPYMEGATSLADGAGGLVPAPEAGDEGKFLKGDGTWGDVAGSAEDIDYDNTESGLTADNVQDAIDEVAGIKEVEKISWYNYSQLTPAEKSNGKAYFIPDAGSNPIASAPTGAISTFLDGTANPLNSLKIAIIPVQAGSGDPSPSNPRAISGWTGANVGVNGKNFFNKNTCELGKWLNVTTGAVENTTSNYTLSDYIPIKAGVNYIFTNPQSSRRWIYTLDKTPYELLSNTYFTAPIDGFIRITIALSSVSLDDIQFEIGSSATTYEPYDTNSHVVPVSWQSTAGTVYGGELNVTTGELTSKMAVIDLGDLNWTKNTETETIQDWRSSGLSSLIKAISASETPNAYCSNFKVVSRGAQNAPYTIGVTNSGNIVVYTTANEYADAAALKNGVTGVKFVYELKDSEYSTYQITQAQVASILGTNNIWCNTGDILECKYLANVQISAPQIRMDDIIYAQGASGGSAADIAHMTWTYVTSTTGTSTPEAIPSGTKRLVIMAEINGMTSKVADESIDNINKMLDVTQATSWNQGYEYADTAGNHTNVAMSVSNGLVTIKSGNNTVTATLYALS